MLNSSVDPRAQVSQPESFSRLAFIDCSLCRASVADAGRQRDRDPDALEETTRVVGMLPIDTMEIGVMRGTERAAQK